jgi:RNA polymerase sigma factor (sigma-70 family)
MDRSPALLLRAAAEGDQEAWNRIVDDYHRLVWSVARGFRLSAADAADVSQTTWLRLVENLDRIHNPDQLAGWLATTARRESLRLIRQSRREVPDGGESVESGGDGAEPIGFFDGAESGNPEDAIVADEERSDLWTAFRSLTDKCRNLLRVVAVTPLASYGAVAESLGMPVGSIGPTRSRCLAQLKRALLAISTVPEAAGPR